MILAQGKGSEKVMVESPCRWLGAEARGISSVPDNRDFAGHGRASDD